MLISGSRRVQALEEHGEPGRYRRLRDPLQGLQGGLEADDLLDHLLPGGGQLARAPCAYFAAAVAAVVAAGRRGGRTRVTQRRTGRCTTRQRRVGLLLPPLLHDAFRTASARDCWAFAIAAAPCSSTFARFRCASARRLVGLREVMLRRDDGGEAVDAFLVRPCSPRWPCSSGPAALRSAAARLPAPTGPPGLSAARSTSRTCRPAAGSACACSRSSWACFADSAVSASELLSCCSVRMACCRASRQGLLRLLLRVLALAELLLGADLRVRGLLRGLRDRRLGVLDRLGGRDRVVGRWVSAWDTATCAEWIAPAPDDAAAPVFPVACAAASCALEYACSAGMIPCDRQAERPDSGRRRRRAPRRRGGRDEAAADQPGDQPATAETGLAADAPPRPASPCPRRVAG